MTKESIISKLSEFNRVYFDKKTALNFLSFLKTKADVFAPHQKGESSFSYEQVDDVAKVIFNYPRTIQSIKKYFLPPRETLLSFNMESDTFSKPETDIKKRIFFGIHSYEMQAVKILDYAFSNGNIESNYLSRRENAVFIGIDYLPDSWHFSKSVGIDIEAVEGFSLFFYTTTDGYIVFEIDDQGKKLLNEFGKGKKIANDMLNIDEREFKTKLRYHHNRLPRIFDYVQKSKVWEKYAQRCLGCGTCNLLCATCYCFDVQDEVELDTVNGSRQRTWDSCMLNSFAEVAGGENFRENLAQRTRHRVYRKFKYITDKSGMMHCIGCGRCSRYCPAGITLPDIVNDLIEDYEEKQMKQVI